MGNLPFNFHFQYFQAVPRKPWTAGQRASRPQYSEARGIGVTERHLVPFAGETSAIQWHAFTFLIPIDRVLLQLAIKRCSADT